MKLWVGRIAAFLCVVMVAATALALIETDEWWIRVLDFPRLQIAVVLILALLVCLWVRPNGIVALTAVSAAAFLWQLWMIVPYTPAWPKQMAGAASCPHTHRVRILMANVLQDNRNSTRLLQLVETADPDLILLTEIDEWWAGEMASLGSTYRESILEPRSNTFGMGLYSRLRLTNGQVRYILEDHVPSILTQVTLTGGTEFTLWSVHPAPPRPGDDTDERDAELLIVAKEAAESSGPTVIAGDLNDVAWSSTTSLFQQISGLLDPRIGRGLYSTFNANWPLMKWPLDHLFASEEWTLGGFGRLGHFGSDHYPILVELCHEPQAAAKQGADPPEGKDFKDANEHIDEGKESAGDKP